MASRLVLLLCLSGATGDAATARAGTLELDASDMLPHTDNVLPFFHFMNNGNEGGVGFAIPPRNE